MNKSKKYKGSLNLDWINKESSLFYEIDEKENKGVKPLWVSKNDIRVAEPRILKHARDFGEQASENMVIKGDNLLVLRSLNEMFKGRREKDRVKCIYIDPPYNTGNAFKYYDDNLKHSQWLTMMRDRLMLLRELLRKDGMIFVQIDDEEMAYLKIIMDDIFGRENFITSISVKMARHTGVKMAHASKKPVRYKEHILLYAKEKKKFLIKPQYKPSYEWDSRYSKILLNKNETPKKWKFTTLNKIFKEKGLKLPNEKLEFCMNNAEIIFRTAANDQDVFKNTKGKKYFQKVITSTGLEKYAYDGGKVLFADNKIKMVNGKEGLGEDCGDLWDDIAFALNDLHNEGGVKFKKSKKPELLLKRIIMMATKENDIVLDSFAGSGTTGAVAQKLNRRWVMIEVGRHAEQLCIKRMKKVIAQKNYDTRGISQHNDVNWQGGGGFKYFKLGNSIIYEKDMNWELEMKEMAQSIFFHFQYKIISDKWLEDQNIFIGKHHNDKYNYAISYVIRETKFIDEDMYLKIMKYLDDKKRIRHLTIFTNAALIVPTEVIDERILIKKIPATILKEYNLL